MTFDQIAAHCEREGLTLTGNSKGWQIAGFVDRFGRSYRIEICNNRSLWAWAAERFR
jgi:hypothetical protein